MKANNNDNYTYYYDDVKYFESQLAELDPKNASDLSMYIDTKVNLETSKLVNEYGSDSWQSYIINTVLPTYINTMVSHEYTDKITKETYNEAKQAYDTAIQKLKSDDWKQFVNNDLKEINKSLEEQYNLKKITEDTQTLASINETISNLEVKKQVNEWRLEKNISYAPGFLNSALESYSSNKSSLISYAGTDLTRLSTDELQSYRSYLKNANLNKYYIENNISLNSGDNRDILLSLFNQYELFILIIGIVFADSIVSD